MPTRTATRDDLVAVAEIYAHYVRTSVATFELEPPDDAEWRRLLDASWLEVGAARRAWRDGLRQVATAMGRWDACCDGPQLVNPTAARWWRWSRAWSPASRSRRRTSPPS